jgi:hypothetical protein
MQISSTNLIAAQQAMAVRPRAEVTPPEKFEPLFDKQAASLAQPATNPQTSPTANAQPSAPAQMGSLLDIRV